MSLTCSRSHASFDEKLHCFCHPPASLLRVTVVAGHLLCDSMITGFVVGVAQLVRALGCGPGGCGFKSRHSPQSLLHLSIPVFEDCFDERGDVTKRLGPISVDESQRLVLIHTLYDPTTQSVN